MVLGSVEDIPNPVVGSVDEFFGIARKTAVIRPPSRNAE